jgi:hypothetical protein
MPVTLSMGENPFQIGMTPISTINNPPSGGTVPPPVVTPPEGFNYLEPDGSEVYVGPGVPYYIDSSGWLYLE